MKKIMITAAFVGILCFSFAACKRNDKGFEISSDETSDGDVGDTGTIDWADDPTIGMLQPGYYQRVGIVKKDETYEEMLELAKTEKQGCLIVNNDGCATFELDGEKIEYVYDKFCLYLAEDTERAMEFPMFISGEGLLLMMAR